MFTITHHLLFFSVPEADFFFVLFTVGLNKGQEERFLLSNEDKVLIN